MFSSLKGNFIWDVEGYIYEYLDNFIFFLLKNFSTKYFITYMFYYDYY